VGKGLTFIVSAYVVRAK